MIFSKKKINTDEYLELKKDLESLKIMFNSLKLDFDLIVKKLKVKFKISRKDNEETEDINSKVLLPEDGMV